MSGPPPLPEANGELRRLLALGPPADGNLVPLMRAIAQAHLIVPMHPADGKALFLTARAHPHGPGIDERCLHAFTAHELAHRWSATVSDAALTRWGVSPSIRIAKKAIELGVDVLAIDTGSWRYEMRFRDMVDLLSRSAFDGQHFVTFEPVAVRYGLPETMPTERLNELRRLGRAHGLTQLSWCMHWVGDAPGEMQLVFAPFPNQAFSAAVLSRMSGVTRDRFTFGDHDARRHRLPPQHLQTLIEGPT